MEIKRSCGCRAEQRIVQTTVSGSRPIEMALCRCDIRKCEHCEEYVPDPRAKRCGSCSSLL